MNRQELGGLYIEEAYNSSDELDVIIGNTKVASHDNELLENISHEYLQAVGLGKEIRYDLTSITVKFMLLQYKDHLAPVYSFTHSERAVLHGAIKEIIMAAELLRAVCAGNSDHKSSNSLSCEATLVLPMITSSSSEELLGLYWVVEWHCCACGKRSLQCFLFCSLIGNVRGISLNLSIFFLFFYLLR
jgi:hypothetical protein